MFLTGVLQQIQHSNSTKSQQYTSLDGLRGMAIIMVVLGHYWSIAAGTITNRPNVDFFSINITKFFQLAGYGVYLFFVMSAFLLYLPYARASVSNDPFPSTRQFFIRRFLRIYPAYAAAIIFYLCLKAAHGEALPTPFNLLSNSIFIHPFSVFLPASTVSSDLLPGTWSLVVEVYFYALLPFVAMHFSRSIPLIIVAILMIGVAAYYRSVVHPLIGAMSMNAQQRGVLLLNPLSLMDCFAIGMLSSRAFIEAQKWSIKYLRIIAPILGIVSICGVLLIFRDPLATPPLNLVGGLQIDRVLMFNTLVGLLIPSVLLCPQLFGPFFSNPLLRFIGIVSYSIFLTHMFFALQFASPVMDLLQLTTFSTKLAFLVVVFAPISIGLGFILYMIFERPWLTGKRTIDSIRTLFQITGEFFGLYSKRSLAIGVLAWYGAAVLFYYGLPTSAVVPEEVLFKAADLTDENWNKGVSRNGRMILIPADRALLGSLKDKKEIVLEDGSRVSIKSIDRKNEWAHLTLSKSEPHLMSYPRRLIGIR